LRCQTIIRDFELMVLMQKPYFLIMCHNKIKFAFLLLLASVTSYAQLGFCNGSKGDPLFSENFGNGSTYGPALSSGITTYPFVTGAPNDGFYTLFYHSSLYSTWHYSLDHTPDATNGTNGKMLIVNANAGTSGDFYKKTVSGLCINTTFEFSAWLLNVYNPTSNYCGAGQIPINVRFEIWNSTETILLGSGNTGNIMGTPAPLWQQFALVFTTVSETSVVLKMKNNGLGGCGNDLAIDDISFSACGDLTTVTSPSVVGSTYSTCTNPTSLQLNASTASTVPYFYQWQTSTDGTTWTDIAGANNPTYTTPNLSSLTYFRARAAQDAANLNNTFCSTASNVFTISVLPAPSPATNNGDKVICSSESIPLLSVTPGAGTGVNWYSAPTGGTLLQANNVSYLPTAAGTFYAETYDVTTNCIASPRTAVALDIVPLPDATMTATTPICSGTTAIVSFSGTPNAIITYTVDAGSNQNIPLNALGLASISIPGLTSNTTYTLVSVAPPASATCSRLKNIAITIMVNGSPTASISSIPAVCQGSSATVNFSGTPNAIVTYFVNTGSDQTITLDASGSASVLISSVAATTSYTLVKVTLGGTCTQTLSQSITLTAVPLPTASISASSLTVCANKPSTINFTGTPNAIVSYTINGGTNQTIPLNASGLASITTTLAVNTTYVLVSVASPVLNTCTAILNGAISITMNALPTASFSSNAPVCSGSSATINFTGTPNAIVAYTAGSVSQTVTLNSSGNASVVVSNVTSTKVYTLNNVTSAGTNGCSKALSQSITLSAVSLPTASISANPTVLCANQGSTLQFSGTPNAVVTYAAIGGNNQSTTLDGLGVASVTITPSTNTTYQILNAALPGTGCSQALSGSVAVSINAAPNVIYTGDLNLCEGEPVAIALTSAVAGTTFSWTVNQSGTTGAVSGSGSQIAQTVTLLNDAVGTVTYTVTPFYNGCTGIPTAITVTIQPLPVPQIIDGVICTTSAAPPSSQFYTLDTHLNPADHSFQWFFGGNLIPGAFGSTYNATQIGTYTVIATNSAGCVSDPVNAIVGQMPQGESLVIEQSETFSDNPMIAVTVIGGDGPFLYQLDDGAFQPSNVFHNVLSGTHTITVVDANCTYLTGTATIINYPKYFTPNGDGFHDTWNIEVMENATVWIFDRYGKLIKQISTDGLGWDGTYNGRALPSTDYWFVIDYTENGGKKTFKAHFSLKR
jgi:gliding motility-associated-like protein